MDIARNDQQTAAKGKSVPEATKTKTTEQTASLSRNKLKVLIAMVFANIFMSIGDISLSKGMKSFDAAHVHGFADAVHHLANVNIIGGVILLTLFLVLYLASLSWEEMSYVLPLTAASYVLVTLLARFILQEDVTPIRWAGALLVATGVVLVART